MNYIKKDNFSHFPFRIEHNHPLAIDYFSRQLGILLKQTMTSSKLIVVCIGTDRSTGDSLGPLVGSLLTRHFIPHLQVYGTLDEPIHALNLEEKIHEIEQSHPHDLILAVDACLGKLKNVGSIECGLGPVKPGAGVNKRLPEVGQIHVTGVVNVAGFMEYLVLQNTRLSLVMKMAEIIAASIEQAIKQTTSVWNHWPKENETTYS